VRGRVHRRIEALRDGALSDDAARKLRQKVDQEPEAARVLEQTELLGRAIREAWNDGPPAPDPDRLIAQFRPGLARIDRELADHGRGRRLFDRVFPLRRPAVTLAAAAAALALFIGLPSIFPLVESSGVAHAETATVIRSLRQQDKPVLVLEGADGATIIWVLDEEDPDISSGSPSRGAWT
jgi:hypothetical protein